MSSDIRWTWRALRREPWPSAAIVLTLGLGIAAVTTVFAVFNHLVFRPPPGVDRPHELISIAFERADGRAGVGLREAELAFRAANVGVSSLSAWGGAGPVPVVLHAGGDARMISREEVPIGYFDVLGVSMRVGRRFTDAEIAGHAAVALVSEVVWKRDFGGTPDVLGRTIELEGRQSTIIGVVEDYRGWASEIPVDVWVPEAPGRPSRIETVAFLLARPEPGQPLAAVQSRLREIYPSLVATLPFPELAEYSPRVYEGLRMGSRPRGRGLPSFAFVLGVSALLLALAAANAANLLLAMTTRRRHEVALRAAMGATPGRLARGLFVEAGVLAAGAVSFGLVLTRAIVAALEGSQPFADGTLVTGVVIDWRVLVFASAAGGVTVLAFGLLPSLSAARTGLREVLQEGARAVTGTRRAARALVAGQLAVSILLTAGAGVLVRSYANLRTTDLGMDSTGVFTFEFDPRLSGEAYQQASLQLAEVLGRLRDIPGIDIVGTSNPSVFDARIADGPRVRLASEASIPEAVARSTVVSPGYFAALGVPMRAGREFIDADVEGGGVKPVILSESLARAIFDGAPVVGRRIAVGVPGPEWERSWTGEVVGVAGDTESITTVRGPARAFMLYGASEPMLVASQVYVRSAMPHAEVARRVREVLRDVHPRLSPVRPGALRDEVEHNFREERALTLLLGLVALVASLIGAAGVYSVTAYGVSLRTREFGVRIALGASTGRVIRHAVDGLGWPVLFGLAAGLGAYAFSARLIASRLVGLSSVDPATLAVAVALLLLVVAIAALVPARRASGVDPVRALRAE